MAKQREVNPRNDVFPAGTLWNRVQRTTARALQSGAMQPIDTEATYFSDRGIQFLIRVISRLRDKPPPDEDHNPFLPCEEALYVANALDSHLCVLNKYNVVDHHLLIVTREFQHQEAQLTQRDFHALWRCMREYESLGFYNSGTRSGASQRHKHLQLIPSAPGWDTNGHPVTLSSKLDAVTSPVGRVTRVDGLPFHHAFVRRDIDDARDVAGVAIDTLFHYREMMCYVGIDLPESIDALVATPYNLLVSKRWMLLVPRARECFRGISLNALAFVGAFLVQDRKQLAQLLEAGPLTALRTVAFPRAE
ncbi:MAG: ATP adenylyltransferase family protein [Planctomycetota bacterium]